MILKDGQFLFHGSYVEVSSIDLHKCKRGLDFGRGFYVTPDYGQAMNYIPSSVRKAVRSKAVDENYPCENGVVSVFRYHENKELLIHHFDSADMEWLHFVSANRDQSLFPQLIEAYKDTDIVCGKIANDRTARTLQAYLAGAYGMPGETNTDNAVINILLPNRLSDQICFRTERSIAYLEFVKGVRYGERFIPDFG